jgi:hypothetical protein
LGRCGPQGELSGTCYSHRQPWTRSAQPPGQTDPHPGKKEKLINKQKQQKRHIIKRAGHPELQRWRGEIHHKLAEEGRSSGIRPATRGQKACKSGVRRKTPQEREEDPLPM